jgi:hypothetical protein
VQGTAVFVIFLAAALSLWNTFRHSGDNVRYDFKESRNQFRDTAALNKAQVNIVSDNITKSLEGMNLLLNGYAVDKPIRKDLMGNHGVFIFNVKDSEFPEVQKRLAAVGRITNQSEVVDTSLVKRSLALEETNLESLKRDFAALDAKEDPSSEDRKQKELLVQQIRQAEITMANLRDSEHTLVYVTVLPAVKGNRSMDTLKKFALNFGKWLGFLFIGVVLVYYGTRLLMYLLSMMGVKGLGVGGVGGTYTYGGYGGYANKYYSRYGGRYGYGGSRRKIKRVYKDKPSTPHTEEDDNTPEK